MGKGMRAGKKPKAAAPNMKDQMQQMQAMQRKMEEAQNEVSKLETTASAGGGAVTVTVSGDKELKNIELKPEIVDPDDIEMLQDLIISATNEALREMEEKSQEEMNKVTASLGLPPGLI